LVSIKIYNKLQDYIKYKLLYVYLAAVRSVKNYKDCADVDIIRPLKPYLANATARGKQKKKINNMIF